eukprot:gnl/TRDRNA2_/TRDRNA2_182030_c0_seq1.p1 gnl/TRDRNA2_/TRDRNA2_182030_c0~~gnl/TRDRNA2_/TRDRNA2_182030_c0_seq1.p1  ORF type:complete len:532 (-),score=67.88 gnl/TRDRNA2_/TRDRNA2_182030_c0_seq1:260-1855(-)
MKFASVSFLLAIYAGLGSETFVEEEDGTDELCLLQQRLTLSGVSRHEASPARKAAARQKLDTRDEKLAPNSTEPQSNTTELPGLQEPVERIADAVDALSSEGQHHETNAGSPSVLLDRTGRASSLAIPLGEIVMNARNDTPSTGSKYEPFGPHAPPHEDKQNLTAMQNVSVLEGNRTVLKGQQDPLLEESDPVKLRATIRSQQAKIQELEAKLLAMASSHRARGTLPSSLHTIALSNSSASEFLPEVDAAIVNGSCIPAGRSGDFMLHLAMLACCMCMLVLKWRLEAVRRFPIVFIFDVLKQLLGLLLGHAVNIFLVQKLFTSGHPDGCTWYWVIAVLDSTLGVIAIWIGVRLADQLLGSTSGLYSQKQRVDHTASPETCVVLSQFATFMVVACFKKLAVVLFLKGSLLHCEHYGLAAVAWVHDPHRRLVFVMIVTPIVMRVFEVLIVDSIIMFPDPSQKAPRRACGLYSRLCSAIGSARGPRQCFFDSPRRWRECVWESTTAETPRRDSAAPAIFVEYTPRERRDIPSGP